MDDVIKLICESDIAPFCVETTDETQVSCYLVGRLVVIGTYNRRSTVTTWESHPDTVLD